MCTETICSNFFCALVNFTTCFNAASVIVSNTSVCVAPVNSLTDLPTALIHAFMAMYRGACKMMSSPSPVTRNPLNASSSASLYTAALDAWFNTNAPLTLLPTCASSSYHDNLFPSNTKYLSTKDVTNVPFSRMYKLPRLVFVVLLLAFCWANWVIRCVPPISAFKALTICFKSTTLDSTTSTLPS